MKTKSIQLFSVLLAALMLVSVLVGCTPKDEKKTDTLVIMTEELNNLFNPFYSTAGTDMSVVGMTQIGMLTTNDDGELVWGEKEPTVALDFEKKYDAATDVTSYYFVLKNGIKFSDGVPLTMNDVLFNMYVYLDPVYTGSTTMYSSDIVGLTDYRMNKHVSEDSTEDYRAMARSNAVARRQQLIDVYNAKGRSLNPGGSNYDVSEAEMREAINAMTATEFSDGFKEAISATPGQLTVEEMRAQLLADYDNILKLFREELESDFTGSKEAYIEEPYKSAPIYNNNDQLTTLKFSDEVVAFMCSEGFIEITRPQAEGQGKDTTKIEKAKLLYSENINTKEKAINFVYDAKVSTQLEIILKYWGSGNTLLEEYIAKATEILLNADSGEAITRISGITSLAHNTEESTVTVNGKVYNVATGHNADGTVTNANEYDVLKIDVNKIDPKAVWNFSFTVAPYHYYSDPTLYPIDIANDKFGVKARDYDFQTLVLQGTNTAGQSKNRVPMGAGAYKASDRNFGDGLPSASGFSNAGIVYFKANDDFLLGAPKIKKVCYQVVSSSNAISMLESGSVHYVEPQFTKENKEKLDALKAKGFESLHAWQLGYGYIGVNAAQVPNIWIRRAIMSAMNTTLARAYYSQGTVDTIYWPMSEQSWAYPRQEDNKTYDNANDHDYASFLNEETAKNNIQYYMSMAGVSAGSSDLKIKFTIAGSNLTEHPTYNVFDNAARILNGLGWQIEVVPDPQALTKLSTGSLAVWAAAWGSTIDPDMYQVYHKDSTASSTKAWGYTAILGNPGNYPMENEILDNLSDVITRAREIDDSRINGERARLYKEAMSYVLDLAVELPVYQRQTLYAYNANVIDTSTIPVKGNGDGLIGSYSSPLSKLWEIDFVK